MARCFFPSCAWPDDGDRDVASLLSDRHRGNPSVLPCAPGRGYGSPAFLPPFGPSPSSSSASSAVLDRAAASKIHSQAERKRRERINGHLATLRRMIPNADKMDKAALLRSVIHEVRVLKRKAADVGKCFTVPAEANQVSVECDGASDPAAHGCPLVRASICCDDRPDLFADITEAFRRLRLRAVKADMASLGGRVRHAFVLRMAPGEGSLAGLSSLLESTRDVLGKVAAVEEVAPSSFSTKRRRFFQSHSYS